MYVFITQIRMSSHYLVSLAFIFWLSLLVIQLLQVTQYTYEAQCNKDNMELDVLTSIVYKKIGKKDICPHNDDHW